MNCRENSFSRTIRTAIGTFHAHALATFNYQLLHRLVREDDAAMRFDESRQRFAQFSGTTFGQRPAELLLIEGGVCVPPSHGILRRHIPPWPAQHKTPAMIVFKIVANDLPMGHGETALPDLAFGMLSQSVIERLTESDWREGTRLQNRFYRFVFFHNAA